MPDIDTFLTKKVAGVKFVYLAAGGAVILALIAFNIWRKDKKLAGEKDTGEQAATEPVFGSPTKIGMRPASTYPEIDPIELVNNPADSTLPTDFKGEVTNDSWLTNATSYLVAQNKATPTTAQLALQHYLNGGGELSFTERLLVDAAIIGVGSPPLAPTLGKLPDAPVTSPVTTTPTPAPTTTATASPYPGVSRVGSKGGTVGRIQARLNTLMGAGLKVDQDFGPKTKAAVMAFQRAQGIAVDGVVGPITWGRLFG